MFLRFHATQKYVSGQLAGINKGGVKSAAFLFATGLRTVPNAESGVPEKTDETRNARVCVV